MRTVSLIVAALSAYANATDYKYYPEKLSHPDAEAKCKANGGELARPTNAVDN